MTSQTKRLQVAKFREILQHQTGVAIVSGNEAAIAILKKLCAAFDETMGTQKK